MVIPVLVWLLGCGGKVSCEQATLSVAVRVWDCTGDADLAWGRARRLRHELGCAEEDEDARTASARCTDEIAALGCDQVELIGDDPSGWLLQAPSCADAFAGEPVPAPPQDTAAPSPTDPGDPGPLDCTSGGPYGCSVAFHAEGDRVFGTMPPSVGALTVEARVRNTGSIPGDPIGFVGFGYGGCNGASLGTISDRASVMGDIVLAGGVDVMSDLGWHTVAAVWDGETWIVVADGIPSPPAITCMTDVPPGTALWIGQRQGGVATVTGEIDEVRLWSRALGADDIGGPVDGTEPGLLAWYPFDTPDPAGRVHNAALTGSDWDLFLQGGAAYVVP